MHHLDFILSGYKVQKIWLKMTWFKYHFVRNLHAWMQKYVQTNIKNKSGVKIYVRITIYLWKWHKQTPWDKPFLIFISLKGPHIMFVQRPASLVSSLTLSLVLKSWTTRNHGASNSRFFDTSSDPSLFKEIRAISLWRGLLRRWSSFPSQDPRTHNPTSP